MPAKRIAVTGPECVACGACVKACPVDALSVPRGLRSVVDTSRCLGCGKCAKACPAGVIEMADRDREPREEKKDPVA